MGATVTFVYVTVNLKFIYLLQFVAIVHFLTTHEYPRDLYIIIYFESADVSWGKLSVCEKHVLRLI